MLTSVFKLHFSNIIKRVLILIFVRNFAINQRYSYNCFLRSKCNHKVLEKISKNSQVFSLRHTHMVSFQGMSCYVVIKFQVFLPWFLLFTIFTRLFLGLCLFCKLLRVSIVFFGLLVKLIRLEVFLDSQRVNKAKILLSESRVDRTKILFDIQGNIEVDILQSLVFSLYKLLFLNS